MTPSISTSGVDAPAVTPTVSTPANQPGSSSAALSTRYAFGATVAATSWSLFEFALFLDPTVTVTRADGKKVSEGKMPFG